MTRLPLFGDPRLPARIWSHLKVDPVTGCWVWQLTPDSGGYGRTMIKVNGKWKHIMVHRLTYESLVGPIPEETLNHRCLNTLCAYPVPSHAGEPMSHADNVRDAKARTIKCPKGHAYDFANTHVRKDGRRECKTCMRDRTAAQRAAKTPEENRAAWSAENRRRADRQRVTVP